MLSPAQLRWGVDQWVAFLKDKEIPVLPRTQTLLQVLQEERGENVSANDLTRLVLGDPFLCLKLLRQAEHRRSRMLGHDTTTVLGSVLQTGLDALIDIVTQSPISNDGLQGLNECEFRTVLAANIARGWANLRADVSTEEVSLAALLSEVGELLLWHFAPELPQKALDELHSGRALRTLQAQQQTVGFSFKQLSLVLAQNWELPPLIMMLIKGSDNARANITRLAAETARHITAHPENPAIPTDIINIKHVIPGASHEALLAPLPISAEYKETVLRAVAMDISSWDI